MKLESGCYQYELDGMIIRVERSRGKWIVHAYNKFNEIWDRVGTAPTLETAKKAMGVSRW